MIKSVSKRRWIARFHLGQAVPYQALDEHPDLKRRLRPCEHLPNIDGIRKPKTVAQARAKLFAAKSIRELVVAARELGNAEFDAGIRHGAEDK